MDEHNENKIAADKAAQENDGELCHAETRRRGGRKSAETIDDITALVSAGTENASEESRRLIGCVYIFSREKHDWDCVEVAVLSVKGNRFKVARSADICEALLAKRESKKRRIETWTCTGDELL